MEKTSKKPFKHQADDILNAIFEMPYMIEFCEGILPSETFMFFKTQDILYLGEFSKGLFEIGTQTPEYREIFTDWSAGVNKELNLLQVRYKTILEKAEMSPSNLLYTSYLKKNLSENKLHKSLAAFYPCFWIYYKVGKYLAKRLLTPNPYEEWITFYHSEEFGKDVKMYKSIINKVLEPLGEEVIQESIKIFRTGCLMEYNFWNSAYNFETWPLQEIKDPPKYVSVLTIAGSDSSGGAGIQADLNTFHAHRVVGSSVITAATAQNSKEVSEIVVLSKMFIEKQIQSVMDDYPIKAIKIGMMYNSDVAMSIAHSLKGFGNIKIVVDPVMISSTGYSLINKEAIEAICKEVFPLAYLLTPNIPEALFLLEKVPGNEIKALETVEQIIKAARSLCEFYNIKAVLVKGGHTKIKGKAVDVLVIKNQEKVEVFEKEYLDSKNTHGTGCSLSSAITANLAKGYSLNAAVKAGKNYVFNAVKKGYHLGKGEFGTLNHFY